MYTQTNHPRLYAAHRAGISIPARRAEFCWTPPYCNNWETAGQFTVLKRLDLGCLDYLMTWGSSFSYWGNLSDVELLNEVLAVGMFAMGEGEVPANRVLSALLRVPEVRRFIRGHCPEFVESSAAHALLSDALQRIVVRGAPAKEVIASLRSDRRIRKWMQRYPNYLRH
jgi:hypothetical protein